MEAGRPPLPLLNFATFAATIHRVHDAVKNNSHFRMKMPIYFCASLA
jgi:hypothetical protein